jgi:hypothetical protein
VANARRVVEQRSGEALAKRFEEIYARCAGT